MSLELGARGHGGLLRRRPLLSAASVAVAVALLTGGCSHRLVPLRQVGSTSVTLPAVVAGPITDSGLSGLAAWAALRTSSGVAPRAAQAYGEAELLLRILRPGCHLSWTTLAGIGSVESLDGTIDGSLLGTDGISRPPIRGLPLDGTGSVAAISDSDAGVIDGLSTVDRAVGPMQIIPQTWVRWATDGDGNGVSDPDDLDDAAATAGRYLCEAGGDLATDDGWTAAVLAYNHSDSYVRDVHAAAVRAAG